MIRPHGKKSAKKPVTYRSHQAARSKPTTTDAIQGPESPGAAEQGEAEYWSKTRHGAIGGRGYHYQETVGALLAAQLLLSDRHSRVVPEGTHEDLDCRGSHPSAVQAKSRQDKLDDFPASEVAAHLLKLHGRRAANPHPGATVLALERDIKEQSLPTPEMAVGDMGSDHPLVIACTRVIANNSLPTDSFDDIVIMVISFDDARRQAADLVAKECGVEFAVAERIVLEFRQMVCDAADLNAERASGDSAFLDRTVLVRAVERMKAETDPSSLLAAIATGACEPLDLATRKVGKGYFEGVHAQPGHIAAGLATARPDLVDAVAAGLGTSGSVVLCGPSGVGKSTAMWLSASTLRHVTWFRVNRLHAADVEDLYRLAYGRRPTEHAPVGLLVDGVGLGDIEAWDHLVRRLAPIPHVFVVGTARVEDTFEITTLTQSSRVDVELHEGVAERIFYELREAGLTAQAHWREAFVASGGLTLEYTYFLTRGRRLGEVLRDQVRRLVAEKEADAEVQLLALATTAHMHGAALSVTSAQAALGLGPGELRRAVARLKDEHFLVETSGALAGLHLMRSRTLSAAVHENPPPTFDSTLERLFGCVPESDLPRLVVGLLRERDDIDAKVIAAVAARVSKSGLDSDALGAVLHAVRSTDFIRHARTWREVIVEERVPPAQWPVTVDLALLTTDLIPGMHPAVAAAITRLRELADEPTNLWDQFARAVGVERVVDAIASQGSPGGVASLLAACRGGHSDLVEALDTKAWSGKPIQEVLKSCSVDDFGVVTRIAQSVSLDFAHQLVELVGGEDVVIAKVIERFPTMYCAERTVVDGVPVVKARLGFVDDELTPDPDKVAVAAARLLLRAVPGCDNADIATVRAGGRAHAVGDLKFGMSRLLYQYSLTSLEVDWNRARSVLVLHELGFVSPGEHAARVAALLPRVLDYGHRLLTLWVTQRDKYGEWDWDWVNAERAELMEAVDELTAPQDGVHLVQEVIPGTGDRLQYLSDPAPGNPLKSAPAGMTPDDAHTVLSSVVYDISEQILGKSFRQLSFRVRTVAKELQKVATGEHWELAGLTGPPPAIAELEDLLYQVADITAPMSYGAVSGQELVKAARSGPRPQALDMAARGARDASRARLRDLVEDTEKRMRALNATAQVLTMNADPDEGYWPHTNLAVVVECETVLEWAAAQDGIVTAVLEAREGVHLPATMVCPSIQGKREPALAFEALSSAYPQAPSYATWFPEDSPHEDNDTLQADISTATAALMRRSSLHYIDTLHPIGAELLAAYAATETQFNEAYQRIRNRGDDLCIDAIFSELAGLAQLVADELADSGKPGNVAAALMNMLTETESDVASTVVGINLCAVQWAHDIPTAVGMIGEGNRDPLGA